MKVSEVEQLHFDIENASDTQEIQDIIYSISDNSLEREVQDALDQCLADGDELDAVKDHVIATLEDNAEYEDEEVLTESKTFLKQLNVIPDDNFRIYFKAENGDLYCDMFGTLYDCTEQGEPICPVSNPDNFTFEKEELTESVEENKEVIWTTQPSQELEDEGYDYYLYQEDTVDLFKSDIFPMIEKQCNDNTLILCGDIERWTGKTVGGKLIEADVDEMLSIMADYDIVELVKENDKLVLELTHHDGTHRMTLYTLPKNVVELAKAMGYEDTVKEDYDEDYLAERELDDVIEMEFNNDIVYGNLDIVELCNHVDKLVKIQNN